MTAYDGNQPGKGSKGYKMSDRAVKPSSTLLVLKRRGLRSYVKPYSNPVSAVNSNESLDALLSSRNIRSVYEELKDIEIVYNLASENKDYERIKGLLKDITIFSGYISNCQKNPKIVPLGVIERLPELRKKLNGLESRIRITLRDKPYIRPSSI